MVPNVDDWRDVLTSPDIRLSQLRRATNGVIRVCEGVAGPSDGYGAGLIVLIGCGTTAIRSYMFDSGPASVDTRIYYSLIVLDQNRCISARRRSWISRALEAAVWKGNATGLNLETPCAADGEGSVYSCASVDFKRCHWSRCANTNVANVIDEKSSDKGLQTTSAHRGEHFRKAKLRHPGATHLLLRSLSKSFETR